MGHNNYTTRIFSFGAKSTLEIENEAPFLYDLKLCGTKWFTILLLTAEVFIKNVLCKYSLNC